MTEFTEASLQAALALGIEPTVEELATVQAHYRPGECVQLLRTDLVAVSSHPDLHPVVLQALLAHSLRGVALAALFHPSISRRLREEMYADHRSALDLIAEVGADIVLPDMALSADEEVRLRVAAQPQTPADTLTMLVADPVARIRLQVAKHGNLAPEACEVLLRRFDSQEMRIALAENGATPERLLVELEGTVDDHHFFARVSVPLDLQERLLLRLGVNADKPMSGGAATVLARHDSRPARCWPLPKEVFADLLQLQDNKWMWQALAANPHTPAQVLRRLSLRDCDLTRAGIAKHRNTPPELLAELAAGIEEVELAVALAQNPQLDEVLRSLLMRDPRCRVRSELIAHPATTVEQFYELLGDDRASAARSSCALS